MNPGRWQEVDALFEEALERSGGDREAFLAGLDPALRPEVEQLLAADGAARTFLEKASWLAPALEVPPATVLETAATVADPILPGRIGPYKVLGVLGEGGMGRVLLASRADQQYQRLVAIKTLRAARGGLPWRDDRRAELLARFDLERQALAQLEHPNIARLYDAGRDERGDPYLVLEHVDGVPLDTYCDEKQLDVAGRLRLFLEVCTAVQAAHRNLLVHRDLKPSNILVTQEGRPMLLDFGIAKLLDPARIAGELLETREGSRPMTPGYASPEQVKGEPITTASDVYSLGVLLYELLTGRKPYRVTSWLPHELEKAICEVEPEKPSTAVFRESPKSPSRDGAPLSPAEVARRRGTSPGALARHLRGDLDTLLSTALRKDPDQRYASVEALVQDVAAFLAGRPLQARPPSAWYTLRKFAARHRFGVAAALALAGLLVVFVVILAAQTRHIRAERDKAERALAFLIEVFKASEPTRAQGEEPKARDILDGAALRIENELAGQPEIQATLMDVMGQVYLGLGLYHDADVLLAKSLEQRRRQLGPDDPATLAAQANRASALVGLGQPEQARELFAAAIRGLEARGGPAGTLADARLGLGEAFDLAGQYESAAAEKEQAIQLLEKERALEPELASAEISLGNTLIGLRQYERASYLYRDAEHRRRRLFGDQSLEVARITFQRGYMERQLAHYTTAIALLTQAEEVQSKLLDPEHPDLLATLENLAICYSYTGVAAESIPLYEKLLAKKTRRYGPRHYEVANTHSLLGGVYLNDKKFAPALLHFEEALAIQRENFGPLSAQVASVLCDRGDTLRGLRRLDEAARDCRDALEIQAKLETSELADRAQLCLGQVELARPDYAAAEKVLRPVFEARTRRLPAGTERVANIQIHYGCALAGLGRDAEAEPLLRRAYATIAARNAQSSRLDALLACLAPVTRRLGRPDAAKVDRFLHHFRERTLLDE